MSLPSFIKLVFEMLKKWSQSNKNDINCKPYITQPILDTKEFTKAYQFKKESRIIKSKDDQINSFKHFFFSSKQGLDHSGDITDERLAQYEKRQIDLKFSTLEQFFLINFGIIQTSIPLVLDENSYKKAYFSCTGFFKSHSCKHIVAICSMGKIYSSPVIVIPTTAKSAQIGKKRSRVRPGFAKKALERQENLREIANEPIESDPKNPKLKKP